MISAPFFFNFTQRTMVIFLPTFRDDLSVLLSGVKYSKKNCACEVDVLILRIRLYRRRSEDCDNSLKHVQGFIL